MARTSPPQPVLSKHKKMALEQMAKLDALKPVSESLQKQRDAYQKFIQEKLKNVDPKKKFESSTKQSHLKPEKADKPVEHTIFQGPSVAAQPYGKWTVVEKSVDWAPVDYQVPQVQVKPRKKTRQYKLNFACDICDFKTFSNVKLEEHVQRREKQTQTLFFCDACEYKSCTSYGLVFHKSKVHNVTKLVKKYTCGYCCSKFTSINHFQTHILSKHMGEEGNYSCEICGFRTFDKCYFGKHMKTHEEQAGLLREIMNGANFQIVGKQVQIVNK